MLRLTARADVMSRQGRQARSHFSPVEGFHQLLAYRTYYGHTS